MEYYFIPSQPPDGAPDPAATPSALHQSSRAQLGSVFFLVFSRIPTTSGPTHVPYCSSSPSSKQNFDPSRRSRPSPLFDPCCRRRRTPAVASRLPSPAVPSRPRRPPSVACPRPPSRPAHVAPRRRSSLPARRLHPSSPPASRRRLKDTGRSRGRPRAPRDDGDDDVVHTDLPSPARPVGDDSKVHPATLLSDLFCCWETARCTLLPSFRICSAAGRRGTFAASCGELLPPGAPPILESCIILRCTRRACLSLSSTSIRSWLLQLISIGG